ncbi:MAG: HDOD domain-containing protein [Deltaproteobacteria bacterium]|nr:HDOD domain-containing protein [Deltaproteobacteria bacterium]
MQRVERVLERVTELPFSPVAAKILELARDERTGARDIAKIVAQDQAFTARLLKIANSPYYGQSRTVTTVLQAVPILGFETISSLALAHFSFSSKSENDQSALTLREVWEHSMGTAFWSRKIARRIGHVAAEETFIAGLLHDMGKALLHRFFKREFLEAVDVAEREGIDLHEAERRILDTDHAAAGAAVATRWHLPPVLIHTIKYHHNPFALPQHVDDSIRKTVFVVHIADSLAEYFSIGRGVESDPVLIDDSVWDYLAIDLEICHELLDGVLDEVNEFRRIFDISTGGTRSVPPPVQNVGSSGVTVASGGAVTGLAGPRRQGSPSDAVMGDFARFTEASKRLALLAGLEELFPNIASEATTLLGADAAHVFVPEAGGLKIAATAGLSQLKGRRTPLENSLAGFVATTGAAQVIANISNCAESWEKNFFTAAGFRSHLFLPVEWAGRRLAVLSIHVRKLRTWTPREMTLVDMFLGLAAVALENSRLYQDSEAKAAALAVLNRDLQAAVHAKTRFLSTVSHELRSPLFVVTGYANLIADGAFGPLAPELKSSLQKIIKQGNHVSTLILNLLETAQIDTMREEPNRWPFDLRELLDEVVAIVPSLIDRKPIDFECDYDRKFPLVVTNRDKLKQVLGRLLDNAVKFTDQGKVILGARSIADGVELWVEDTGIGIESANLECIFDGFRQVDEEDHRRYAGMGLGLYLSRQWLTRMEGRIEVESRPGQGSRFRVWLPHRELPKVTDVEPMAKSVARLP